MTEHKREYMKKYYLSHKEQYAEHAELYRQRNKEKYRE